MPQIQTLLNFNTQYLNATYIDHFYNIDDSLYRTLQHGKMHIQAVSLLMFVSFLVFFFFYLKTMGSDNSII